MRIKKWITNIVFIVKGSWVEGYAVLHTFTYQDDKSTLDDRKKVLPLTFVPVLEYWVQRCRKTRGDSLIWHEFTGRNKICIYIFFCVDMIFSVVLNNNFNDFWKNLRDLELFVKFEFSISKTHKNNILITARNYGMDCQNV